MRGVEIVAFPECCITGYWHLRHLSRAELDSIAEPVFEGPSSRFLRDLSRRLNITIGAGTRKPRPGWRRYFQD